MERPFIIKGGLFTDERGYLKFFNSFTFEDVKRFYIIENKSTEIVRAWQAHKRENKYFVSLSGIFLICAVRIDDWQKPSLDLKPEKFFLKADNSEILKIPKGYANGIKALDKNSKLLIFSSNSLEIAQSDDFRYPSNYWCDWNTYQGEI